MFHDFNFWYVYFIGPLNQDKTESTKKGRNKNIKIDLRGKGCEDTA